MSNVMDRVIASQYVDKMRLAKPSELDTIINKISDIHVARFVIKELVATRLVENGSL